VLGFGLWLIHLSMFISIVQRTHVCQSSTAYDLSRILPVLETIHKDVYIRVNNIYAYWKCICTYVIAVDSFKSPWACCTRSMAFPVAYRVRMENMINCAITTE